MKSWWTKTAELLLVLGTLALSNLAMSGCSGPEIKRDTPQATVATLIKIYEANKPELLSQIVSPAYMREEARSESCLSELLKDLTCTAAMLQDIYSPRPEGCPVNVKECLCKTKGPTAAEKAKVFQTSEQHKGLLALKLTAKGCTITGVDTPNQPEEKAKALPVDAYCDDFTASDGIATVSLKCNETPLEVVVQRKSDAWWVIGFSTNTSFVLTAAKQTAGGEAYRKRLNADLK